MKKLFKLNIFILSILIFAPACLFASDEHDHGHGHGHGHDEEAHEEPKRGPMGGRLFEEDDFSLELTIFEDGVPPEFRVFLYDGETKLPPTAASVKIVLNRFGGVKEEFLLSPKEDYLTVEKEVSEPHSFEVEIEAKQGNKTHKWEFDSFEGRTTLTNKALRAASLQIEVAGAQRISNTFPVYGRILPNEDKTAHITARFPGIIKEIRKKLGDKVEKGEVLAIVESNQSLQPYEIRSLIAGEVIGRHGALGEFAPETQEILTVSDLSEVWADFQVYRDESGGISKGKTIKINLGRGQESIDAVVSYVSPLTDETTQSKLIRAILPNPNGSLRPGLFISGELTASEDSVPLAVKREAIQTFRDWNVVYITDGHVFQAMPVELGRRDSEYVEIISGIKAGDKYAAQNSFIVKADVEKSGASHDH